MSAWYYTSPSLALLTVALNQINSNCGFPNAQAQTWAEITQSYNQLFYFFIQPPPWGMRFQNGTTYTQAVMINGVTQVDVRQSSPDWWPSPPLNMMAKDEKVDLPVKVKTPIIIQKEPEAVVVKLEIEIPAVIKAIEPESPNEFERVERDRDQKDEKSSGWFSWFG